MLVFHEKVFEGGLSGTGQAYSLPRLDSVLASATRWYVTVRCTRVSGTSPSVTVSLQQSATGAPGEFKNVTSSGKVPLNGASISAGTINIVEGSVRQTDTNIKVPAGAMRLEISLGTADNNAYVEVWVTGRDDP